MSKLEPLLKEADDYYSQENYKDDKMAKGKALHPRLVAAWDAFAAADQKLRGERRSHQRQARAGEARRDREKRRPQGALPCRSADDPGQARAARRGRARPDIAAITQALTSTKTPSRRPSRLPAPAAAPKIGSFFIEQREVVPHHGEATDAPHPRQGALQPGDKMMLSNAGSGWMVEGSPQRLLRDYNQLVEAYNRGANI